MRNFRDSLLTSLYSASVREIPGDFVYGKLDPKDYRLVRSRTQIPRQDRTLRKLCNIAVYPKRSGSIAPTPIAWAFLGLDASLTTLHVEPEHRGLGLAKSLSLKLFADDMESFWQHNPDQVKDKTRSLSAERYGHADVATDNGPSNGVCKSLGGSWNFFVYWLRIDVTRA